MREQLAMILAAVIAMVVVIIAAVFSLLHNAPVSREAVPDTSAGRVIYERLDCSGCHSISGQGNPRTPLDGVALKYSPEQLRDWVTAADSVRPLLPASVARIKQSYASLPEQEFQSLLDYLETLKTPTGRHQD